MLFKVASWDLKLESVSLFIVFTDYPIIVDIFNSLCILLYFNCFCNEINEDWEVFY